MTSWLVFAASLGFLAGMLVMAAIVAIFPSGAASVADVPVEASSGQTVATPPPQKVQVKPSLKETPPPVTAPERAATPGISVNPFEDLRQRNLTLPVLGIKKEELRDTFNEMRGSTRRHEAIDVLAPRNTPVLAVEDGKIAKLFVSQAGGITIYQFDPSNEYVYYYAHLEGYVNGLEEGDKVKRGEVIGYVGTTGNAPRDTPHLHFAIFKMTDEKRWWEGTADRSLFGPEVSGPRFFEALDNSLREGVRRDDPRGRTKPHHPRLQLPIDHDVQRQADASVRQFVDGLRGMPLALTHVGRLVCAELNHHGSRACLKTRRASAGTPPVRSPPG